MDHKFKIWFKKKNEKVYHFDFFYSLDKLFTKSVVEYPKKISKDFKEIYVTRKLNFFSFKPLKISFNKFCKKNIGVQRLCLFSTKIAKFSLAATLFHLPTAYLSVNQCFLLSYHKYELIQVKWSLIFWILCFIFSKYFEFSILLSNYVVEVVFPFHILFIKILINKNIFLLFLYLQE